MLKTTPPSKRLISDGLEVGDGDGNIGVDGDRIEHAKKSGKLKAQKLSKSQKSAKLEKKLSKNENLSNFNAKENGLSFLTPKAKTAFNCLWLTFIEALILWHFDSKCHI